MAAQSSWLKKPQLQSALLLGLVAFFLAHFVLLSPSNLEDDFNSVRVIHPRDLLNFLKNEPSSLTKGVPTNLAPSYSIRDLDFYASVENHPSWRLLARKANLYQPEQIVHSREPRLELPDKTVIIAKESLMWTEENRVEVYGDAILTLPSGLKLMTNFATVIMKPRVEITIPLTEKVTGLKIEPSTRVDFESYGLTYIENETQDARLLSKVIVNIQSDKTTHITSDYALYQNLVGYLNFSMIEQRPLEQQFVHSEQTDLKIKSRSLEVELKRGKRVEKITALGDVLIHDYHDPKHVARGTCGKAEYYEHKNEIHLTDFPQVYQDGDTITGDLIVFDRNRDVIKVKQSNAIYRR